MTQTCISCHYYDEEAKVCTNQKGRLHGVTLTDALAAADNGCETYKEAIYRITPKGILWSAMRAAELDFSEAQFESVWNDFDEGMHKNGYVEEGGDDEQAN